MVGVGGLEPPTSRTRTVRATKLRHTPTVRKFIIAPLGTVVNGRSVPTLHGTSYRRPQQGR